MGIIVQKFGGSSVADTEKLFKVCKRIINEFDKGNKVVVVVSAQGRTTDVLISEETEITNEPSKREHDVLVSTGEQITIAKLTMCLNKLGYDAISYMGWQLPIITDKAHGESRIKSIDTTKILNNLDNNTIVVVAGFQGVDENGNITTFGRGGSDTSAVALAAVLKADKCEIFTDVDGVFSADPRVIEDSIKIETITYDEMLELASAGAKVLHNRCVEIGRNFEVPILVKSTMDENLTGTIVRDDKNLEDLYLSGIAKIDNIAKVTLVGLHDKWVEIDKIFNLLSDYDINLDIIVQSYGNDKTQDISFSIQTSDLNKTLKVLNENLNAKEIVYSDNLAKISLVGVGILNTPGVAARMFEALTKEKILIHMISTSEIKISVLIDQEKAELAMKVVHDEFIQKC